MRSSLVIVSLAFVSGAAAQPITSLPYSPSLDVTSMDTSVQACDDFYRYSCGNWVRKNPIPPDQAAWDVYSKLAFDNERLLWGLLKEAARPDASRAAAQQKIGDYFHACMDQGVINQTGLGPIQPALDEISRIKTIADLSHAITAVHVSGLLARAVFRIASDQDFENSQSVIAFATRGRLGLPDRDYYTKTDPKSVEIRAKYVDHMKEVFRMLGETPAEAEAHAKTVMDMETDLAKAELTRVEMRNPHNLLHKMSVAQFVALAPSINWNAYFSAQKLPQVQTLNVTEPAYYQELEHQLKTRSTADWRNFLRWNLIRDSSDYLSEPFVQSHFLFFSKYLRGVPERLPQWKKCVHYVDRDLGEALGQVFVDKTFAPETKARTMKMTREIEAAMDDDLRQLPWMEESTRQQALVKLHAIVNKIGYPDRWRDYSALEIKPGDFFGNVERAQHFEDARELAKIGKPLDRGEWDMTPPTVNAYYNPQMDDINFPAGVLQPPLYDPKMDDAPNYGDTGSTIGHELTHGFDDEGRQFDAQGNLKDWWTTKDSLEFQRRVDCVSNQYGQYTAVDDIKINSKLTLGEDVADLGGTLLAYIAWKHATAGQNLQPIDGLTPDQRYFVGMAQWACGDMRPEMKRERALTDPHSPLEYRVNGVVSNMPEFATAFGCKVGQPMVRKDPCRVW